jgi:hypothetical protein
LPWFSRLFGDLISRYKLFLFLTTPRLSGSSNQIAMESV